MNKCKWPSWKLISFQKEEEEGGSSESEESESDDSDSSSGSLEKLLTVSSFRLQVVNLMTYTKIR